jgi:anti-anti-sigma factor
LPLRSPKVFQYERQDDTLIVIPNGDSLQVLESDLRREVDALHKLMDTPGLVNVVVDVGNAPHCGSIVIGAIMALCKKANNRGGLAAFCNASDGMLDMLQIMKIDSVMPYYPTRREALDAVRRRQRD